MCGDVSLDVCVSFIVSYASHLLISGTSYAVHINASSLYITKVFIARNNIDLEIIRFLKK